MPVHSWRKSVETLSVKVKHFIIYCLVVSTPLPSVWARCPRDVAKKVIRKILGHGGYKGDLSRLIPSFPAPLLGERVPVGSQNLWVWAYSGMDLLPETPQAAFLRNQIHPVMVRHVADVYRKEAPRSPTLNVSIREIRTRDSRIPATDLWFAVSTAEVPTRPDQIGLALRISAPFAVDDVIWTALVCDTCGVSIPGLKRHTSGVFKDFGQWGKLPMERETVGLDRRAVGLPQIHGIPESSAAAIVGSADPKQLVEALDRVVESRRDFSLKTGEAGRFSLTRPGPGDSVPMAFYRPALFYAVSRMFGKAPLDQVEIFMSAAGPVQERLYRAHMGAVPIAVVYDIDSGAPETVLTIGRGASFLQRYLESEMPEIRRSGMFTPIQIETINALPRGQ